MLNEPNILFPNPDNKKVVELLADLKTRGYVAYVYILKHLVEHDNLEETNYKALSYTLHYPATLLKSIIEDYDLFVVEEGTFYSPDIEDREREIMEYVRQVNDERRKAEIAKKRAEAGRRHKGNQYTNGTNSTFVPNQMEQNEVCSTVVPFCSILEEKEKEEKEISLPQTPTLKEKELKEKEEENSVAPATLSPIGDAPISTPQEDLIDYAKLVEYWNNTTNGIFGKILSIENTRRKMVAARIRQFGKQKFIEAIHNAMQSDFLKGQKGFVMTFDWFIRPNNFQKVLEHNYDNRPTNNIATSGGNGTVNRTHDDARAMYRDLDELTSQVVLSPSDVQGLL